MPWWLWLVAVYFYLLALYAFWPDIQASADQIGRTLRAAWRLVSAGRSHHKGDQGDDHG
jgi:hypothetical protein